MFGVQEKRPSSSNEFSRILNACRTRTEVSERVGYDEAHEFHDDTAVHAAIRANSPKTLMVLLKHGADPTLRTGNFKPWLVNISLMLIRVFNFGFECAA